MLFTPLAKRYLQDKKEEEFHTSEIDLKISQTTHKHNPQPVNQIKEKFKVQMKSQQSKKKMILTFFSCKFLNH